MVYLSAQQIETSFSYPEFIPFLSGFLTEKVEVPPRNHFTMGDNTLLLMPAWNDRYCGVKVATASPGNRALGKPTIHAVFTLFDVQTGEPLAQMDGKILTNKRTAAASALAAAMLAREDSRRLLMIGNGALCPELIRAHASVRPLEEVQIWGRNAENVHKVIDANEWAGLTISLCSNLPEAAANADVISAATGTIQPVLQGKWLSPGTHIDLVGSYRPDMREADDEVVRKATIFVDNRAAMKESGDLAIPLKNGNLTSGDIRGTLENLVSGKCNGRTSRKEITLFKSVGFALEDLAAAVYLYEQT